MVQRLIYPLNILKSGYSFLRSSVSGDSTVLGMPVSVNTELTNNCNLSCPECASGSGRMLRSRGFMDIDLFIRVIKELRPYLYNLNLYFQGEPMLHPRFFTFLENCRGIKTVVSTNGHFLSESYAAKLAESGIGKLIISVDGIDQDTYSYYRQGGSFDSVSEGLNNITKAKKDIRSPLKIEIQFLVNKINENQIKEVRELARRYRVVPKFKSMQILDKKDISTWLPEKERFRRYKKKNSEYVIKRSLSYNCARLWFNPVITWDGKVIPCCFDKDAEFVMGDLNNDTFREIWNGPKYRIFRKSILTDRQMTDICRNCTSGLRGVNY